MRECPRNLWGLRVYSLVLTVCLLTSSQLAWSATTFNGSSGADLATAGNWSNGLPNNSGNLGTVPTGFATTTGGNDDLDGMDITFEGSSSLHSTAGLKLNGGTFSFQDTSVFTSPATLAIGRDATGPATLNVSDSASVSTDNDFKVGFRDDGILNMTGGTLNILLDLDLGGNVTSNPDNDGIGTFNFSGGTANFGRRANWDPGNTGSVVNFTAGSTGIMTFGNEGADYTATLLAEISEGDIVFDGSPADASDFLIDFTGGVTSIQLATGPAPQPLGLIVNTTTGLVTMTNPENTPVAIDYYEIRSASGDLIAGFSTDLNTDGQVDGDDLTVFLGAYGSGSGGDTNGDGDTDGADFLQWQRQIGSTSWNSLEDQNYDGNGWEEGETVSSSLLFETFLTGSSDITNGADISLGNLFTPGGTQGLTFEYHVAGTGDVFVAGDVSYVSSASAVNAVPEPTTYSLFFMAATILISLTTRSDSRLAWNARAVPVRVSAR